MAFWVISSPITSTIGSILISVAQVHAMKLHIESVSGRFFLATLVNCLFFVSIYLICRVCCCHVNLMQLSVFQTLNSSQYLLP